MSRTDRHASAVDGTVSGTLRVEPTVRALSRRLRSGDIAVIDVLDLDQKSAEALAARRPAAVVNVQHSISGRFPTGGPGVLMRAGIPLIDAVGADILGVRDGTKVSIDGGAIRVDGDTVATGTVLTDESHAEAMRGAADGLTVQLATFTSHALDHVEREAEMILEGAGLPDVGIDFEGRHVVVVAPGFEYRDQLASIRRYMRDRRPLIVAVGDAADATMELTSAPDLIVGDVEAVSDDALTSADTVLLHSPHGGDAGRSRLDPLGLSPAVSESSLPSVALAILLAHSRGAKVIVTVGVEASLQDYLESNHTDASGMFLARLQAGASIVDAPALAQVYRHRYSPWTLILLVVSGLVALGAAVWVTPGGRAWMEDLWESLSTWIGGL